MKRTGICFGLVLFFCINIYIKDNSRSVSRIVLLAARCACQFMFFGVTPIAIAYLFNVFMIIARFSGSMLSNASCVITCATIKNVKKNVGRWRSFAEPSILFKYFARIRLEILTSARFNFIDFPFILYVMLHYLLLFLLNQSENVQSDNKVSSFLHQEANDAGNQ